MKRQEQEVKEESPALGGKTERGKQEIYTREDFPHSRWGGGAKKKRRKGTDELKKGKT